MEAYATKQATIAALLLIGMVQDTIDPCLFYTPGNDKAGPVEIRVYQCTNGYWCITIDNGYRAPIVWNGPKADWDDTDPLDQVVEWLNTHHDGWSVIG